MTWTDLKESITQDYRSRGLKDAQARLNALKRVESMLFEIFPDFDGIVLCNMDKDDLKQILESKKGKKLSGSENNVVNEIYNRLPVIRSQAEIGVYGMQQYINNVPVERFKVYICPHCFISLEIKESLWEEDYSVCLNCGNTIRNPVKEEQNLQKISRLQTAGELIWDIWKTILVVILMIFVSVAILKAL